MASNYDLVVIGAGSGGVRASRVAASLGAKVAVIEGSRLGGTCVNLGCVPKKLMVYAGRYAHAFQEAAAYGWTVPTPRFDWATLIQNKEREVTRLNEVYGRLLEGSGVQVVRGWARFVGPRAVSVDGQVYEGRNVLLATGSAPWRPPIPGVEHSVVSDQIFSLPELPERILIVGAGYIGCEFASLFHNLGRRVTLAHRRDVLLHGFDEDAERHLGDELQKRGLDLRFHTEVAALTRQGGALEITFEGGATEAFDLVLMATGRRPNLQGLGLEGLALTEDGYVAVDEQGRTNLEGVYAIGDLIDTVGLTPVALHEGTVVANALFGDRSRRFDHELVPTAVFSDPEVGTVGLTEREARARHGEVKVFEARFTPMKHTLTGLNEKTYMKLVVHPETDRVLGFHVVGPDAAEMTQGVAVALKAGATKADFDRTIGIHPTAAEEFVTLRTPRS